MVPTQASTTGLLVALMVLSLVLFVPPPVFAQEDRSLTPTVKAAIADSAVQTISQIPDADKSDVLTNVKVATDGIHLAVQSAANKDTSKMLKGIGDAVSVLPGAFGFAGIAFSVAASVFAAFGGGGKNEDPVVAALKDLRASFTTEMAAIESSLKSVNVKLDAIISGIDRILSEISDIPAKVVAEMKLTDITTMKDKFAVVQRTSQQYASGNLTREQMVAKCDDFDVAALFSELETILRDENRLLTANFDAQDRINGRVQVQLLAFYLSVVPLVTNCNALKYSIESIRADGERISALARFVYSRVVWHLTEPDRTIYIRERFNPFDTAIDADGYKEREGWTLALSFKAYSFAPPHAACFEVVGGGKRLASRSLELAAKVPNQSTFCTKSTLTDDASQRIVYSEHASGDGGSTVAILQPESGSDFDNLDERGWTLNILPMYSAKAAHWARLPRLRVISDLLLLEGSDEKVSVDEITAQCRALGAGYDRDGDAHSKDYSSARRTIFCVQYQTLSLREVDTHTKPLLTDVQFNDMAARDARTATCDGSRGYVRDAGAVSLPSKIRRQFFGGATTVRAFAVCLKWAPMTSRSSPSQFIERVWLDDSAVMPEKPKQSRFTGSTNFVLPTVALSKTAIEEL